MPTEKRDIKVVFTDVDGTLLDENYKLRCDVVEDIRAMNARGISVVLATGRGNGEWINEIRNAVGHGCALGTPAVLRHGRLVLDESGNAAEKTILHNNIIQKLMKLPFINRLIAHNEGTAFTTKRDERLAEIMNTFGDNDLREIGSEFEKLSHPDYLHEVFNCEYLLVDEEEDLVSEHRRQLEALVGHEAVVLSSIPGYVEVIAGEASKATGVQRVLDMLSLHPSQALVIGDGENDVEMLSYVKQESGVSVAMGNAVACAKEAAEFSTSTNCSGGWSKAMRKWVL
eukprot:TRINITY_DN212_c3_g1_i1.p1 TRINITY_DN212_c3_g1~~TRINITY_DN212_c3_g1_i1.p1  ORF type:complete len:304 (+),score=83.91 TRINITY_DN212_c3_g1_i1:59-913(+)